jgi:hypothetical protein
MPQNDANLGALNGRRALPGPSLIKPKLFYGHIKQLKTWGRECSSGAVPQISGRKPAQRGDPEIVARQAGCAASP